jgi:hypothetical protein
MTLGHEPTDTPARHALGQIVPPEPLASPMSMLDMGDDVPWWTPSWRDRACAVGWKWIFALPAVLVLGLMIASFWYGQFLAPLWMMGVKVIVLSLAVPVVLLLEVVRGCMAGRKGHFCIHCGYSLDGLPDHYTCPECGRPYSFALVDEYRRDPHWFIQRYKMRRQLPQAHAPFAAGPVASPRSSDGT